MSTDKVVIVSPPAKAIFPNLLKHEEFQGTSTGKYSLTMVFDKADIKPIEKAIAQAGGGKGTNPLKKIADDAEYDAGKYTLKAKSAYQVKAINAAKEPISLDEVNHGSEVRVKLSFAPYTQGGGGVTTYLGNVQLLKAGDSGDMDFGELPEGYEEFAELPF